MHILNNGLNAIVVHFELLNVLNDKKSISSISKQNNPR